MDALLNTLQANLSWLYILSIPLMSAIVGWATNVLALKMTFYPLDFVGLPPYLGWQGIIPSKARKMASTTVDLMTTHLVQVREVFARLDADRICDALEDELEQMIRQTIHEVASEAQPDLWPALPAPLKDELVRRACAEIPHVTREALADIQDQIEDLLDLKTLAIDALVQDRDLLNQIFLECGREEFRFIERSGLFFGFLFGILQAALCYAFADTTAWLMPLMGFIVGYITNALALRMIFAPRDPKRFGPLTWQGLFFIRQPEVAEAFARMIAAHVVSTPNLIRAVFQGPTSDRILAIIQRHIQTAAKDYGGAFAPMIKLTVGSKPYEAIKATIAERIVQGLPAGPAAALEDYAREALDIERTLRDRLTHLPRPQFENLLRPIFQEDEWKLILVGALLGMAVGVGLVFLPGAP